MCVGRKDEKSGVEVRKVETGDDFWYLGVKRFG